MPSLFTTSRHLHCTFTGLKQTGILDTPPALRSRNSNAEKPNQELPRLSGGEHKDEDAIITVMGVSLTKDLGCKEKKPLSNPKSLPELMGVLRYLGKEAGLLHISSFDVWQNS